MGMSSAMRPFHAAALALFSAGATPSLVARQFQGQVGGQTIYRWYNAWAELKGIDRTSQLERKRRTRRVPEYVSELTRRRQEVRKAIKEGQGQEHEPDETELEELDEGLYDEESNEAEY